MSDQQLYDSSTIKLPDSITKHDGYYDSEEAAARYEQRKREVQALYSADKVLGKRRRDGSHNLKKLKPRHLRMIAYFVEGMPSPEIARILDVSHNCVLRVLKDPLAAKYIEDFAEGHKNDFNAMFPLVNDAIHEALMHPTVGTKLKGVDRWNRLHKTINGEETDSTGSVKTKEITASRFRFVEQLKEAALQNGVIEAEIVTVTETVE